MIDNDPNDIECGAPDEGAALGLLGMIKGISEQAWCAGWMSGIEFDLWDAPAGKRIGQEVLTARQAALLKLLSEEAGGWWRWTDGGPKFLTLKEWKKEVRQLAE